LRQYSQRVSFAVGYRPSTGKRITKVMASEELQSVKELLAGIDFSATSLDECRTMMESTARPPADGTNLESVDADGVGAEWTSAPTVDDRVILYLHGGAYHVGSIAICRRLVSLLSAKARARVLNVSYRLAPEYPFPSALDDVVSAYRWLLAINTPPSRIAIAGDSAGGGLALAALLALRDAGVPMPGAAVAISPVTDLDATGESMRSRAAVDLLVRPDGMKEAADWYLAGENPRHPYASPLYGDVTALPPMLIQVGDAEVLLDDSTRFAAKVRDAGGDVTLEVWPDMPHVWHAFNGLLPEADRAMARIGSWLQMQIPAGR
jgi:epsilon-lactone hydrolase